MEYYSAIKKDMSYQATKRYRGTLNAHCQVEKKPVLNGYKLYYSNYMTFKKGQNYGDSIKISSFQGLGWRGGMKRWSTDF